MSGFLPSSRSSNGRRISSLDRSTLAMPLRSGHAELRVHAIESVLRTQCKVGLTIRICKDCEEPSESVMTLSISFSLSLIVIAQTRGEGKRKRERERGSTGRVVCNSCDPAR